MVKLLERLQQKASFPVLFAEKVWAMTPSYPGFEGVVCIRIALVSDVNCKRLASLNVRYVQISSERAKDCPDRIKWSVS